MQIKFFHKKGSQHQQRKNYDKTENDRTRNKKAALANGYKLCTARVCHIASLNEINYIVTKDNKINHIKKQSSHS